MVEQLRDLSTQEIERAFEEISVPRVLRKDLALGVGRFTEAITDLACVEQIEFIYDQHANRRDTTGVDLKGRGVLYIVPFLKDQRELLGEHTFDYQKLATIRNECVRDYKSANMPISFLEVSPGRS